MTEAYLDRIESALGFPLPAFYRRFMVKYPRWLLDKQPAWFEPVTGWHFADDAERVIEFNRHVRGQERGEFVDGAPWPDKYLVIGNEGDDAAYYVVNRLGRTGAVYRWSHDEGKFRRVAASLPEFRDKLCVWFEEWKRDAE